MLRILIIFFKNTFNFHFYRKKGGETQKCNYGKQSDIHYGKIDIFFSLLVVCVIAIVYLIFILIWKYLSHVSLL